MQMKAAQKLARKTFECRKCQRTIRMLVVAQKLSVICDGCRGQAQLVDAGTRPPDQKEEGLR